jgi:uncharacterized protein (TIGR04222 family)
MNWLLHNVIADMYGPYFLCFYAAAIVALVVASYRSMSSLDHTKDLELPPIWGKLDAYEIAYLRGGENEVTRVAIASLIQRGLLRIVETKHLVSKTKEIDKGREPAAGELAPIEVSIMKWPEFPASAQKIFQPRGIPAVLREACDPYQAELLEKNLLTPPEVKQTGERLFLIGLALIIGLGGYKLAVALANGHHNVLFLVVLGTLGIIPLAVICLAHPRATELGRNYLEQLKLAYQGLNTQVSPIGGQSSALALVNEPGFQGTFQDPSVCADCLLMVGIFGMASLAGTPMSDVTALFKRGTASGGGCGAGCGAGAGGCGGGGGGCGGGGCGGCGGG